MGFDINLYHNPRLFITRVVNFRFISYRTETGIFSISIRYNNKLFTPLVLSINSRIFFFKCLHFIRLRESFMLFFILFFSSWKAGMFSMIVKQDAFFRSNRKSFYSEQRNILIIFHLFLSSRQV